MGELARLLDCIAIFVNLFVLALNLKLYTEIMKEKSQRRREHGD